MLKIHNTLSGKKEEFLPIKDKTVNMYVCGITPYDEVHLGHARCYVVFDVIRRYLKYKGYNVKYVQNFTDIDDKIINRSKELNAKPEDLAEKNINDYFSQMRKLNVLDADSYPKVTHKIPEIITFIEKIIRNSYAYVAGGDVYFSVKKFAGYGKLSKRNIDDLKAVARISPDEKKNDPLDFALWKKAKEGEPFWDSPWGKGRPGWHIECSAMSLNEFGFDTFHGEHSRTIDIHGGGQDLIFPHHENELAQSESATGKQFVKYWIHNGFVIINREKMSKSLGNFFTLREIFEKYDPMVVRYMLLSQHYRQPLDFSEDKLEQAKTSWNRIIRARFNCKLSINSSPEGKISSEQKNLADEYVKKFTESMDDDFNTSKAISFINEITNQLNIFFREESISNKDTVKYFSDKLDRMCEVLGLDLVSPVKKLSDIAVKLANTPHSVTKLVDEREQARKSKNWKLSDELREEIKKEGFEIEDTKFGSKLKKI